MKCHHTMFCGDNQFVRAITVIITCFEDGDLYLITEFVDMVVFNGAFLIVLILGCFVVSGSTFVEETVVCTLVLEIIFVVFAGAAGASKA